MDKQEAKRLLSNKLAEYRHLGYTDLVDKIGEDGGWRAFRPLCEDFIVTPDGRFVGE